MSLRAARGTMNVLRLSAVLVLWAIIVLALLAAIASLSAPYAAAHIGPLN